jgi:branched-chain amino acid transport system substrate-binding protein
MKIGMLKAARVIFIAILCFIFQACSEDQQTGVSSARDNEIIPDSSLPEQEAPIETRVQEEQPRALKIGVIGPETGNSAAYGLQILEGITLAAGIFNAEGGINGQPIEVIHYDNKDDSELTDQAVNQLIQQGVIAIFAAPTGWSTFGSTHIANNTQTLLIAIGSRRRIGRSGPYIFRFSLSDELATDDVISYSRQVLEHTHYALVTSSNYDYSLDLSALFRKAVARHGGSLELVTDTYDTFSGESDLEQVVEALKKTPAPLHAVIYTGGDDEGARLALAMEQAGLQLPIIGGEDLYTHAYLEKGKKATNNTLIYNSFSSEYDSPQVVKFMRNYGRNESDPPNRFVALAYDGFMFVAGAINAAASTKSSEVREAMLTIHYQGVTGETSFSPDGSPIKHPFLYRAVTGENGEQFVLLKHSFQTEVRH